MEIIQHGSLQRFISFHHGLVFIIVYLLLIILYIICKYDIADSTKRSFNVSFEEHFLLLQ